MIMVCSGVCAAWCDGGGGGVVFSFMVFIQFNCGMYIDVNSVVWCIASIPASSAYWRLHSSWTVIMALCYMTLLVLCFASSSLRDVGYGCMCYYIIWSGYLRSPPAFTSSKGAFRPAAVGPVHMVAYRVVGAAASIFPFPSSFPLCFPFYVSP